MNTPVQAKIHEPRVNELATGFFQFVGVDRSAHVYVIRGKRRTVMLDSGLPASRRYLEACLRQVGMEAKDLDMLILTHEHVDHAGGAPYFSQFCVSAAHPHAANKLRMVDEFSMMKGAFEQDVTAFETDILIDEGCCFDLGGYVLDVISTPGHCSGSICLLERNTGLMVTADTVMANGIVGGVLHSGNVSDYITSLERLKRFNIKGILPGHGKVSFNPQEDLQTGISRLQGMLDDSHSLFNTLRNTNKGFDDVMRSLRDLNVK